MAYDSLQVFQALVTKSTGFSGTAIDLITGTPRRGLKARIIVPTASQVAGNGVVTFTVDASADNTTFNTIATSDPPITNSATAVTGVIFVPFETSRRYVRVSLANTISTGTAAIAYQADLGLSRPG